MKPSIGLFGVEWYLKKKGSLGAVKKKKKEKKIKNRRHLGHKDKPYCTIFLGVSKTTPGFLA